MVPNTQACLQSGGRKTGDIIWRYQLAMSALPFATAASGVTSWMFPVESVFFNAYALRLANRFRENPSQANASAVFKCSLWYLPLVMGLMVFHQTERDPREWNAKKVEVRAAALLASSVLSVVRSILTLASITTTQQHNNTEQHKVARRRGLRLRRARTLHGSR